MNYIEEANNELKEYFKILEPNFPEWLNEYIETKELLSQKYISITCGTIYSDLFESKFFFSSCCAYSSHLSTSDCLLFSKWNPIDKVYYSRD